MQEQTWKVVGDVTNRKFREIQIFPNFRAYFGDIQREPLIKKLELILEDCKWTSSFSDESLQNFTVRFRFYLSGPNFTSVTRKLEMIEGVEIQVNPDRIRDGITSIINQIDFEIYKLDQRLESRGVLDLNQLSAIDFKIEFLGCLNIDEMWAIGADISNSSLNKFGGLCSEEEYRSRARPYHFNSVTGMVEESE